MTNRELNSLCRELDAKTISQTDQVSKRLTTLLAKVDCRDMLKPLRPGGTVFNGGGSVSGSAIFCGQLHLLPRFTPRQWLPFLDELTFILTCATSFPIPIAGLNELTETFNHAKALKQLQDLPSLSLKRSPKHTKSSVSRRHKQVGKVGRFRRITITPTFPS